MAEPNSPFLLCLQSDDSAQEFPNECFQNQDARKTHEPTIGNWLSHIKWIDNWWHQRIEKTIIVR